MKQGELQSVQFLEDKQQGTKHIYTYRTKFKNSTVLWNVEFDNQKKVLAINPTQE